MLVETRPGRAPTDRRERRIAAGLRVGDPAALERLHEAFGPTVFRHLLRLLGDRMTAEDVFQQVMVEVWRRGADYRPERASLLTWVLTIARSRAIDELRRRHPEPRDPHDGPVPDASGEDAAGSHDSLLERWRLAHLLARLPAEEALLLRLRFYGDMSQTEIAASTGVALGTVKTRMVRGLERLRDHLDAEEAAEAGRVVAAPVPGGGDA